MRKSIGIWYLLAALAVAVVFLIAVVAGADSEENRYAELQLSAARKMADAEEYIRQRMLEKGIEPEPNVRALIRISPQPWSAITMTQGSRKATWSQ